MLDFHIFAYISQLAAFEDYTIKIHFGCQVCCGDRLVGCNDEMESICSVAHRLQASPNLITSTWIDLLEFTNMQPEMKILDSAATNFSQRFYRVKKE